MKCPLCHDKTEVLETRTTAERTIRRRRCINPHCLHRFKTTELNNAPVAAPLPVSMPAAPVEDDAMQAAVAVDRRRAQMARARRVQRRVEREAWYETDVPDTLTEDEAMKEIRGY